MRAVDPRWIIVLGLLATIGIVGSPVMADRPTFASVRDILSDQCLDCHNPTTSEGGLDLHRFDSLDSTRQDRETWKRVFDVVEAGQMPLHDSGYELTARDRDALLSFVADLQALPEPSLGVIDPGKPVLRRLTRLGERSFCPASDKLPKRPQPVTLASTHTNLPDAPVRPRLTN